ncbi:MAG: TIGR02996 domain-containing protein [Archangium sp.]|nr:TIGR02996 domain-containing protein [Archangium sp.]
MREHDYTALSKSVKLVREALGIDVSSAQRKEIETLCEQTYDRRVTFALVLAVIARALRDPNGLAWERLEDRSRFTHLFAVVWKTEKGEERLTLGIGHTYVRKTITNVWRSLEPWKSKLELNVAVAQAWAKDATQHRRLELAISHRPQAPNVASNASEEEALLAAIVAAPHDDGPRLVYADWLQERGDARGEFIRLQIELARSKKPPKELRERVQAMLDSSWGNFAGELKKYTGKSSFQRGFPSRVSLTGAAFAKQGERFFSRWPIEILFFDNTHFAPAQLAQLVDAPAMTKVRHLALAQQNPRSKPRLALAALAGGKRFQELRTLEFMSCGATAKDWEKLFSTLDAPKLEKVELSFNYSHPALFSALASNPLLPALKTIEEYHYSTIGRVKPADWRAAFVKLAQRSTLEKLELNQCMEHTDDTLSPFFEKASKCALKDIHFVNPSATDVLLAAIVKSPSANSLESIRIHNGHFTLQGVLPLLKLPKLKTLAFTGGYDDDAWPKEDVAALLKAMEAVPASHPLQEIGLPAHGERVKHERFSVIS